MSIKPLKSAMSILVLLVALGAVPSVRAADSSLTSGLVERIRSGFEADTHTRVMINAITNANVKDIAMNRDIVTNHEDNFSHKVKTKGITDQKGSGRCWLFAGLNVLRPKVINDLKLDGFEFSQSYLAFWDKLEKSNLFYEDVIRLRDKDLMDREVEMTLTDPIGDGGWWNYAVSLIEKYGVVPKSVMPESNSSSSTGMLNNTLQTKLRSDAVHLRNRAAEGASVEALREDKERMLAEVYRILVINYGNPPAQFEYRYKVDDSTLSPVESYTPREFYKKYVDIDLGEYVILFHNPTRPTGRYYQTGGARNVYGNPAMSFVNVEVSVLKDVAKASLMDDQPVWFACDVGPDQNRKLGIMALGMYNYEDIYGIDMGMTKAERILYRETSANHAMVLTGVDIRDDKPVKWLVENSWGEDDGAKGVWSMYDSWFDEYVFNVIVEKKYVPKDVLKIFETTPEVLPPWDPLHDLCPR